jgi:hypothetical protein
VEGLQRVVADFRTLSEELSDFAPAPAPRTGASEDVASHIDLYGNGAGSGRSISLGGEFGIYVQDRQTETRCMTHDVFISYATEDNDFASDVAYGLKANGISVWFAPLSLKVGDKLLDSVEQGIQESRKGILVLSVHYLEKGWTSYEMDILLREHVERRKTLLPVWLGVTKAEVDARHAGLGGIIAITDTHSIKDVISKLIDSLSDGAPVRGLIPGWENPAHRFLRGRGEINLLKFGRDSDTTTIFELLLHGNDDEFPLWLAGETHSKQELLSGVEPLLVHEPDLVKNWVGEDGYKKLWAMCVQNGFNPALY